MDTAIRFHIREPFEPPKEHNHFVRYKDNHYRHRYSVIMHEGRLFLSSFTGPDEEVRDFAYWAFYSTHPVRLTAWDWPREVQRHSTRWVQGKNGGFSFEFPDRPKGGKCPAINIRKMGEGLLIGIATRSERQRNASKRFQAIYLKQIAETIAGKPLSFEDAYKTFVPLLMRLVVQGEVAKLQALETTLLKIVDFHQLTRDQVFSAGTFAKAKAKRELIPPRQKFSDEHWGKCMEAYYGGLALTPIVRESRLVTHVDFSSTYPNVALLLGSERLITADELHWEHINAYPLLGLDYYDQQSWKELNVICRVQVAEADRFPVRAEGHIYRAGRRYTGWFCMADCVASFLLTGRRPKILEALRMVPIGGKAGFLGGLINKRERSSLDKRIANIMSYGMWSEVDPGQEKLREIETGDGCCQAKWNESPGTWYFPPVGTTVTAGARLLLAMLQSAVEDRGGSFVTALTDSMAIIKDGSLPVSELQEGFRRLVPDSHGKPFLKIEHDDVWCYAVRKMVYCLHRENPRTVEDIMKASEQGFDFRAPSEEWIKETYLYWLGGPKPAWFSDVAVMDFPYNSPAQRLPVQPFETVELRYGLDPEMPWRPPQTYEQRTNQLHRQYERNYEVISQAAVHLVGKESNFVNGKWEMVQRGLQLCQWCHKPITGKREDAKFCSDTHSKRYRRKFSSQVTQQERTA